MQDRHKRSPPDVLLQKLCSAASVRVVREWASVAVRRGGSSMGEGHNGVEPHVGAKCVSDCPQEGHISHVSPAHHMLHASERVQFSMMLSDTPCIAEVTA